MNRTSLLLLTSVPFDKLTGLIEKERKCHVKNQLVVSDQSILMRYELRLQHISTSAVDNEFHITKQTTKEKLGFFCSLGKTRTSFHLYTSPSLFMITVVFFRLNLCIKSFSYLMTEIY